MRSRLTRILACGIFVFSSTLFEKAFQFSTTVNRCLILLVASRNDFDRVLLILFASYGVPRTNINCFVPTVRFLASIRRFPTRQVVESGIDVCFCNEFQPLRKKSVFLQYSL